MQHSRTTPLPFASGGRARGLALVFLAATVARVARGDAGREKLEPAWVWAAQVSSPRPVEVASLSDREAVLQRECGRAESGLRDVAARLVERKLRDLPYLDADALSQAQRVAGEPHVWPRAWVISGRALDHETTRQKLGAWGAGFRDAGERRCGVAVGYGSDGTEVVAAVALDAQADLEPLPTRTHVGAWLPVDVKLLVPAMGARVIVMGPSGRPRAVPTQLRGDRIHAQVALDRPGAFTVQVVADIVSGPRPILEAEIFADATPWSKRPDLTAPGEAAPSPDASDAGALLAMVEDLRANAALPLFTRDSRLDALALAHARRMQASQGLAHDAGDGGPSQRLEAAGLSVRESGENVAHADSILLAHRALYSSPSHRANLLAPSFDRVGVGVVRDSDGTVWVTEEFAK